MTGQLTLYGAGELLNSFFGRGATPPNSFYLALIKDVAPTPYVNGNELDEPIGGGYARAEVPNDAGTWSNAGALNITGLQTTIEFVTATADWGTIRYWALCNDIVSGSPYFVGQLDSPQVVLNGEIAQVDPGDLDVELGPFFASWEV